MGFTTVAAGENFDRLAELKSFDNTKTGVKGLVDSGTTLLPRIFHIPPNSSDRTPVRAVQNDDDPDFVFPIIDLQGVVVDFDRDEKKKRKEAVQKVKDASEHWGFFQVVNHGVPLHLLEEMEDGTRRFHEMEDVELKKTFFERDDPTKKVVFNSNFDLYSAKFANWRDTLYCQMAPSPPLARELPDCIREILMEYSKQVLKLGEKIFQLLSEALGLPRDYLNEIECAKGLEVGCHYYPVCPQPELTLGATRHRDQCFLTVLQQDRIGGLQIVHKNYWVDVPPVPGAFLVNIGDLLQMITNDKFISVEHRVLAHDKREARISVASFFTTALSPNPRLYGPIKELLSEDNPPKYKETTVEEHTAYGYNNGAAVSPLDDSLSK